MKKISKLVLVSFILFLTFNLLAVTPVPVIQRVIDDDGYADIMMSSPSPGTAQSNFSPDNDNNADSVVFELSVTNGAWTSGNYEIIIDINRDGIYDSSDWNIIGSIAVGWDAYVVWDGHNKRDQGTEGNYSYIVPNGNYNVRIRIDDNDNSTIDSNIATNFTTAAPYTAVLTGNMTIIGSTNKSQVSMQTWSGTRYSNPVTNGQMYYIYGLQNQNYNAYDLYARNIELPSVNGVNILGDYNAQFNLTSGSNTQDITMDDTGKTKMSGKIIDYLSGDTIANVSVHLSPNDAFFLTASGENTTSDIFGNYRDVYRGNGFYAYTIVDQNNKYGVARGNYYINSNNSPITQNFYVGPPSTLSVQLSSVQDNVDVTLYMNGFSVDSETSDTNGMVVFSKLSAGNYDIIVDSFSNTTTGVLYAPKTTNVTLVDGESRFVNLPLTVGYRVFGTVRTNGDGVGGVPFKLLTASGEELSEVYSDVIGYYSTAIVPSGNYKLSYAGTVSGPPPYYKQKSTNIIVNSTNLQVDLNVEAMSDMITLVFTNWTHYTNGGAMVMAYGASNGAIVSDPDAALFLGMFSSSTTYMFVDSPTRNYTILLGYVTGDAPTFFQSKSSNQAGDTVIFTEASGFSLSGTVINSNTGAPIPSGIFLYTASTQFVAYIGAETGTFNYTNINMPGPYIAKIANYDSVSYKDKWFTGLSANSTVTLALPIIDTNPPVIKRLTPLVDGMLTKKDYIQFYVEDSGYGVNTNSILVQWISGTGPNFGTKTLSSGLSYSNGLVTFNNTGLSEGLNTIKILVADNAPSKNTNLLQYSFTVDTNAPVISVTTFTDVNGTHDNVFGSEFPYDLDISLITTETGNYTIYLDDNKNGIFDPETDWYLVDASWHSIHNQIYTNNINYEGQLYFLDVYGQFHNFSELSEGQHVLVVDFDDSDTVSPHDGNNVTTNIVFYKDTQSPTISSIKTIDSNTLKIEFDNNSFVDSISMLGIGGKTNVSTNIVDNIIYLDFIPAAVSNDNLNVSLNIYDKGNNWFATTTNIVASFSTAPGTPVITNLAVSQTNDGSGKVVVRYTGIDSVNSTCTYVAAKYSLDNATWNSMTVDTNDSRYTSEPLPFTSVGATMTYVWDSQTDVPNTYDGTVWVKLEVNNGVSNSAVVASSSFVVDNDKPTVPMSITPASNTLTNSTTLSFTWNASPDGSGSIDHYVVEVASSSAFGSIEKSASPSGTSHVFATLTEGTKYWRVRAYDAYGNVSANSVVWTVKIDVTGPTAPTLVSPTNGTWMTNTKPTFVWNASTDLNGVASYDIVINGVTHNVAGTNFTPSSALSEGTNTWTVRAIDNVGNGSAFSSTNTVNIDTTGPSVPALVSPTNSAVTKDPTPAFVWNATTDGGAGVASYEINIDGNVTNVGSSTNYTPISALIDGSHTWQVRAIDSLANVGAYSSAIAFTIDTTAPLQVSLVSPANNSVVGTTNYTFVWNPTTDATSGLDKYIFEVDFATNFSGLHVIRVTNGVSYSLYVNQGTSNYWRVRAYDLAGNTNTSVIYKFTVDTNQITPILYTPANSSYETTTSVNFTWSLETGISSNQIVIDTSTNTLSSTATNYLTTLTEAVHTWMVRVYKTGTGWQTFSGINSFTIDTIVPTTVSLVSPANNVWSKDSTPEFVWNKSTDGGSGIASYDIVIDSTTNSVGSSVTNYTPGSALSEGSHTWQVRAVDNAGNKGNFSSRTIMIDTIVPSAPVLVSPTNNAATIDPTPEFIWNSSTDTNSGVASYDIVIDSTTNNSIGVTNYTAGMLTNGAHTWQVRAVDYAGNNSTWSSNWTITVTNSDTTPPSTPVLSTPADGVQISEKKPTFTWSSSVDTNSGVAGYEFVIDGITNIVTGISYTPASELNLGTHTWKVRAVDAVGNKGAFSTAYTFTIKEASGLDNNTFSVTPNPFLRYETLKITYKADSGADVKFEVYTMLGRLIKTIIPDDINHAHWYGVTQKGKDVSSGMYLVIMRVDGKKVYKVIKVGHIGR